MTPAVAELQAARRAGGRWRKLLLGAALLPIAVLVVLELCGSRGELGFLSGSAPSNGELGVVSGAAYALAWFTSVVVSPILLLALGADLALQLTVERVAPWLRRALRRHNGG